MSRKPENKYMDAVHDKLPKDVRWFKITPMFSSGIPDVFYEGPDCDIFIEYKFIDMPKRDSTIIDIQKLLSEHQTKWLKERLDVVMTSACDRPAPLVNLGTKIDDRYYGGLFHPLTKPMRTDDFRDICKIARDVAYTIGDLVGSAECS